MQRAHPNRARPHRGGLGRAPLRRPGGVGSVVTREAGGGDAEHPLVDQRENARLFQYEDGVKQSFDKIKPVLKQISAFQHEADFEQRAQQRSRQELGFNLPQELLADAWVSRLDMKRLFAWCVFETYRRYCDAFFKYSGPEMTFEAASVARIAVHAGRLEQVGRPEELYRDPRSRFVATFIGRALCPGQA